MNTETRIGKIQKVSFGFGGYQEVCIGLSVTLGSNSWGVQSFKGAWGPDVQWSEHCKWTEKDRHDQHAETVVFVGDLLKKAKAMTVDELKDVPIEATFVDNTLRSWRILEEAV